MPKAAEGVIATVRLVALYDTLAATGVLPSSKRTVLAVTLAAWSASLKVMVTEADVATFVAPPAGLKLETVGGVVSAGGAAAVVKVDENDCASGLPAWSFTPGTPPTIEIV